jgi:hypothetical protein
LLIESPIPLKNGVSFIVSVSNGKARLGGIESGDPFLARLAAASSRPNLTDYRGVDTAYRIALKSLARQCLELHDEIADLDAMMAAIVDQLALNLVARHSIGHTVPHSSSSPGDNPEG